jgi:hypothetical protein
MMWLSVRRSEAFWADEGVCQIGKQEQCHATAEDVIDKHGSILRSNSVAGFDVGEGQAKKQNPDPENNDVHCACSLLPLFYFAPAQAAWRLHENGTPHFER